MSNLLENTKSIPVFKEASGYKYPWAVKHMEKHMNMFWKFDAVDLGKDVENYKNADEDEKIFISNVMKLFTGNEVVVGTGYDAMCSVFKPTEVLMMLRQFNARENTHTMAYSLFTETLGLGDSIYTSFLNEPVMETKTDYINKAKVYRYDNTDITTKEFRKSIARMLAVYAGGTELISLYSQFAMLLSYQFKGKYPGLCTIVEYSIKDEYHHGEANCELFRTFISENPDIWDDELKFDIYEAIREIVDYEIALIDYLNPPHMDTHECKQYIRYQADNALSMLGMKKNWNIKTNPFKFMDEVTGMVLTDFFNGKVTSYSREMLGTKDGLRAKLENKLNTIGVE